jgi:type II secretory pathway pseudopilin PulG
MNKRSAFTILELLLAMALSSFIMLGMFKLYQGVVLYAGNVRNMMNVNRKVCLLFNQLERDFSTAYIPILAKKEKTVKDDSKTSAQQTQAPAVQSPEEQKKEEEKAKALRKTFFVATIDDRVDFLRIDGVKVELLKALSFICTNPLQVFSEKQQRLVRVVYELVVDKAKSTRDQQVYKLIRKETFNLSNTYAKVDEYAVAQKKLVRSFVVADNVKGLYVQYILTREETQNDKKKEESKELKTFTWGDRKETQAVVPQKTLVWIDIFNDERTKHYRFHALFPIFSYPTKKDVEDKKDEQMQKQEQPVDQGSVSNSIAQQPATQPPVTSIQNAVGI